ncbi:hypothetical protein BC829DRAFT_112748 [Chytridium lagenaria]|nr:hypothetical protein BC829DRAFT_112748 [Chytridium lagenaria]
MPDLHSFLSPTLTVSSSTFSDSRPNHHLEIYTVFNAISVQKESGLETYFLGIGDSDAFALPCANPSFGIQVSASRRSCTFAASDLSANVFSKSLSMSLSYEFVEAMEVADILKENKCDVATLRLRLEKLKERVQEGGDDVFPEAVGGDKHYFELVKENRILNQLIKQYESTMEVIMAKFRAQTSLIQKEKHTLQSDWNQNYYQQRFWIELYPAY